MPIKIASRKAKARRLQQWVAKQISEITGIECGKDEEIESREMGQCGCDVKLYGVAKELFPFSIECKAQENVSLHAWIKQAKENQQDNTDWLLVFKRSREDPVVVMDAKKFFGLYEDYLRWTEGVVDEPEQT